MERSWGSTGGPVGWRGAGGIVETVGWRAASHLGLGTSVGCERKSWGLGRCWVET